MKDTLIAIGLIIAGFITLFVLVFFSTIPYHNFVLKKFANELLAIESSPEMEILEEMSKVGVLSGNGNHCDYYASVLVKSVENKDAVLSHYTSHYLGNSQVEIVDVRGSLEIEDDIQRFIKLSISPNYDLVDKYSNEVINLNKDESLYIVYVFEHGMTWRIGDFRCS